MIESMGSIQKRACARHIEKLAADRSSRRSVGRRNPMAASPGNAPIWRTSCAAQPHRSIGDTRGA